MAEQGINSDEQGTTNGEQRGPREAALPAPRRHLRASALAAPHQFLTVEAWAISSMDVASADSNSPSLIDTRRSWTSAREKLAIMP